MASFGTRRFRVNKKYLAFFTIVPLMAATAFIKAPCPVCGGTGAISSTGMTGVVVTALDAVETDTFLVGCDSYRVYQYAVDLTVQNEGTQGAGGYVGLCLVSTETGQLLDTEYTVVEVGVGMSLNTKFNMAFKVNSLLEQTNVTEIKTKILNSDVQCNACGGKGSVALNSWPLLKSMKDSFVKSQRVATPFLPPLYVETEANPGDY
jgi:hypothetical protein